MPTCQRVSHTGMALSRELAPFGAKNGDVVFVKECIRGERLHDVIKMVKVT